MKNFPYHFSFIFDTINEIPLPLVKRPNMMAGKCSMGEFKMLVPLFDRLAILVTFFSQYLIFQKIEKILDLSYDKIELKYPGLLKRILETLRKIPQQRLLFPYGDSETDKHWVIDVTIHSLLWKVASLEKNYIECHKIMQYIYQISRYSWAHQFRPVSFHIRPKFAELKPLTDFYQNYQAYLEKSMNSLSSFSNGLNMDYAYALTCKYSLHSIWPLARLLLLSRNLSPHDSPIALIQEEIRCVILPLLINRLFYPILLHRPLNVARSCIILKSHDHVLSVVEISNVMEMTSRKCSHCNESSYQRMVECTHKNCTFKACIDKNCWKQYEENHDVSRIHYDPVYLMNECTYFQTGKEFYLQEYYQCADCNHDCCVVCSKVCHAGHRLGERKIGDFYCDCGETATCCSRKKIYCNKIL